MTFVNPALAVVAIGSVVLPIIIHFLLRRKRPPVAFGAMRFLLAAYRTQQRRLKLEQLLLLLLRCAVVVLLGVAIGRPIWGALVGASASGVRNVVLVVETGLSSQVRDASGETALARAIREGQARLSRLDAARGDRAALVVTTQTHVAGALADPLVRVPLTPDVRAVERALVQLRATDAPSELPGAIASAASLTRGERAGSSEPAEVVLLSELRSGGLPGARAGDNPFARPLAVLAPEQARALSLSLPVASDVPAANVAVAEVQPLRAVALVREGAASQPVSVRVRVVRWGSLPAARVGVHVWARAQSTTMQLPDAPDATGSVEFAAGSSEASVTLGVPVVSAAGVAAGGSAQAGVQVLVARVVGLSSEQDAIASDNTGLASISVQTQLLVAVVGEEGGAAGRGATGQRLGGQLGAAQLGAADWLSLALQPQATDVFGQLSGEVQVRRVLAGELVGGSLATGALPAAIGDVSAVFVCQPQLLSEQAWQTLARARQLGKPIVVVPPDVPLAASASGSESDELAWARRMGDAFGLTWEIAGVSRAASEGQGLEAAMTAPAGRGIVAETTLAPKDDPLALLRSELPALARSVRVFASLSVTGAGETGTGGSGTGETGTGIAGPRVLLGLEGGTPLIVASDDGAGRRDADGGNARSEAGASAGIMGQLVVFLAAPTLAWTDLPARPLMVPLVQELVRQIAARDERAQQVQAGQMLEARAAGLAEARVALVIGASAEASDVVALSTGEGKGAALVGAGVWTLRGSDGATRGLALVSPALQGSDTTVPPRTALAGWLAGPGWRMAESVPDASAAGSGRSDSARDSARDSASDLASAAQSDNVRLSLVLLVVALALLMVETVVARLMSHARPTGVSREGAIDASGVASAAVRTMPRTREGGAA